MFRVLSGAKHGTIIFALKSGVRSLFQHHGGGFPFYIMAKNPVFPLYFNDFDRSTRDWTDEEVGCYIRLLLHQWDKFGLPLGFDRLSRISTSVEKNWDLIGKKFEEMDGVLKNARLEEIREERIKTSDKQSVNGSKGGRPPKNKPNIKANENPNNNPNDNPKKSLHNEYEYEDSIVGKDSMDSVKGKKGPDYVPWFTINLSIPDNVLESAEMNQHAQTGTRNTAFLKNMWKIFLNEKLGLPPIERMRYKEVSDLSSHFLNFVRNKFPKKNGQHNASAVGKETPTDKF